MNDYQLLKKDCAPWTYHHHHHHHHHGCYSLSSAPVPYFIHVAYILIQNSGR